MKEYKIFYEQTDEYIGEIMAIDVLDAELRASRIFNTGSDEIYALSKEIFES